ncbi:hypothetical protein QEZ54_18410 [Catellatospora sp. KI3]|uniref:hypothetical protein n=1 Tax=Catellatospora sp. KI3 TaxID=3041620 RepID=UPI002482DA01|nr:hypothetical protein [Catellatospora sp. KI3]MDI1462954.1 hypothetical protein [Catellatospora sp. KI3]
MRVTSGRLVAACVALAALIVGGAVAVRLLRADPASSGTTPVAVPSGATVFDPVHQVVDGGVQVDVSVGARVCPSLQYVKETEAAVRERMAHHPRNDIEGFFAGLMPQEVNAAMTVSAMRQEDGSPVRITDVRVDVVRTVDEQVQHGVYMIYDLQCEFVAPGVQPMGGDEDTLEPTVFARFGGDGVAMGNNATFVAAPTERVHRLNLRPLGCGRQVSDWIATVGWADGDRTGTAVFGPFRTVPQQDLPQFKLGRREFGAPFTLTPQTGGKEFRPCVTGPVPDPRQPAAAPYCGSVDGPGGKVFVRIARGPVDCAKGRELIDAYLNHPPTPPQGTGRFVEIGGWECTTQGWVYKAVSGVGGDCGTKESSVEFSVP